MIIINISPHSDPLANLGEPDSGGQCVYEHQLALALSNQEHTVFTFCRDTGQRPKLSVVNENYYVFRITAGPKKFIPKENLEPYMNEFVVQIQQYLDALEPQNNEVVIHAHYWDGARASLELAAASSYPIPMVWTPHSLGSLKQAKFAGLSEEMKYNFIPRKTWENYMVHLADAVIVSSKSEADELQNVYAAHEEKISIIQPGIDLDRLSKVSKIKARKKLGLPENKKIVLSFGRLTPSKGYERAILGFSELDPKIKKQSLLVICGGNLENPSDEEAKYYAALQQLVFENDLENQVIFLPSVAYEEVSTVYNAADLFLSTALQEPYGLTIQEAMAAKLPVVIDKSAGCKNLVQNKTCGLITDTGNPRKLALSIQKILKNTLIAQEMGIAGNSVIKTTSSWDQRVNDYVDIYSSISPLSNFRYYNGWVKSQPMLKKMFSNYQVPTAQIFKPKIQKQVGLQNLLSTKKGSYENSSGSSF